MNHDFTFVFFVLKLFGRIIICERLRQINERIAGIFSDPERSMAEIARERRKILGQSGDAS